MNLDDEPSLFLSRLIDRAAQRAPLIERRRPALFEPRAGLGAVPPAPPTAELALSDESVPESPSTPSRHAGRSAEPAAPVHTVTPFPARRHGPPPPLASSQAQAVAADWPRAQQVRAVVPAAPTAAALPAVPALPSVAARAEGRLRTEGERAGGDEPHRLSVEAPARLSPAPAAASVDASRIDAPPRVIERRSHETVIVRTLPPPRIPERVLTAASRAAAPPSQAAPAAASRRHLPGAPPSQPPSPVEPPPVQISIGRIEIRTAAPAAGAPKATRPNAPRLSLDDYLRGRGNGGPTR